MTYDSRFDASQVLALMKAQANPRINILSIDNAQEPVDGYDGTTSTG